MKTLMKINVNLQKARHIFDLEDEKKKFHNIYQKISTKNLHIFDLRDLKKNFESFIKNEKIDSILGIY